ncbi:hypothetical protein Bca4012_009315 [Brassica carinata]|uniref:Uncharacterized protein n=1 Tax=Brassica carinata TaxID=52824 RepID=A0A8X7RYY1_BRACI|nr:hypothetical protein Bca52824_034575 [Brassica carinata]
MRFGRFDLRALLKDFRLFLRKNIKRVILSTGVIAVPSPSIVPYSDFVMNLRGCSVSKVLFEEGSCRIYYNSDENFEVVKDVHNSEALEEFATEVAVIRKVRALAHMWKYVTRKVDHDEKFLLSLMREKEIT